MGQPLPATSAEHNTRTPAPTSHCAEHIDSDHTVITASIFRVFSQSSNHVHQERHAKGYLIIPFQMPPAKESASDLSGTLGSTLPMAAMFTRNKFVGWASVVLAIQNWLGESAEAKRTSSQPAYFSVGMGIMALVVTYLPMFLPPPGVPGAGTGTEAPAAAPPS